MKCFLSGCAAALCGLLAVTAPAAELDDELNPPRIVVVGEGKTHVKPDMALIQLGVVTEAESAAAAVRQNSEAMRKLLDTLKSGGIHEDDIQTSGFNVSPRYQHDIEGRGAPRIVGYEVSNEVTVKARQLAEFGSILDQVVQSGANRVHAIQFTVSEPAAALDNARQEAIADAARKARIYADTAGVKVGKPLAIKEQTSEPVQPVYGRQMAMAEMARNVPIATGEQTLRATVQVTYELAYDE